MILKRIKEFIDYKEISNAAFEKMTGLSNGTIGASIRKGGSIGVDKLENILRVFTDLNPTWVLLGEGEMLRGKTENTDDLPTSQQRTIEVLSETINRQSRIIEALTIK